ncbi:MAG TPA: tetratricopeptide repeat protein [Candidatus Acidoferrum sp.]|nr:tetratricopeptide repeat protein [Candidatus Acidoferrum sp.]
MPCTFGRPRIDELLVKTVFVSLMAAALCSAQTVPAAKLGLPANSSAASGAPQKIYVVLPFEGVGAPAKLDWLSEGLEELTIERLTAAGEQVYSHSGRAAELERYGLPSGSTFSRATMLRIAEDLDADYVIYGKYAVRGTILTLQMRILSMDPLALRPPVQESGSVDSLTDLHMHVLWRTLSSRDGRYALSLADFAKRQRKLRLDAFEQYSRGLQATDPDAKVRQLHEAARLEPDWPDANFALGEAYFAKKDYNAALAWFFKVPKTYDRYAEALFFSGVCRLQLNQADHAEEDFRNLQETLKTTASNGADAPEILNNLAIAQARQGKVAPAQASLRRAADLAPGEDDYSFNLGLLALQGGDAAVAADYFRQAAEREPDSSEDRALLILSLEKADKTGEADQEREAAKEAFGPTGLPPIRLDDPSDKRNETLARLTRIKTELDLSGLRAEPADAPASTASVSGASDTPASRIRRGRQELSAGNMAAAEEEFRAALSAEPSNAAAHRGLGEIARHQGKMDDAVKELQDSLATRDSPEVRTMLAKIYLEQKKTDLARAEAEKALKLAPNYAEAKQLLDHLQNSKSSAKKPGGGGL